MAKTVQPADDFIVMRFGQEVTVKELESPANPKKSPEPVDTQDKLTGLSVQVWPVKGAKFDDQKMLAELTKALPGTQEGYTLTRSGSILKRGGTITFKAIPGNDYHAEVSGITVPDLVDCFKKEGQPYKPWVK